MLSNIFFRKICFSVIFLVALSITCSGCDIDPHKGHRPIDFPNSQWVCEEYSMRFTVNENGEIVNSVFIIDGKSVSIDFLWEATPSSYIDDVIVLDKDAPEDSNVLFSGDCEFHDDYFCVTIKYDPFSYFSKDTSIHFYRLRIE